MEPLFAHITLVGKWPNRLSRLVTWLSAFAAIVAVAILFAMVSLVLVEIVLRSLFATSTFVTQEMVAYGLAAIVFLTLAYALRAGILIRVDILTSRLKAATRRLLEIGTVLATCVVTVFLIHIVARSVIRLYASGAKSWSYAPVPLWVPEVVSLLGLTIFMLQLIVYLTALLQHGQVISDRSSEGW